MRQGFDNEKYIANQAEHIKERIAQFGGKLYLEFGGKLFDDYHASRVLPGFEPDSKFRMLKSLADDVEIIIAINANHIEKNRPAVTLASRTTRMSCALPTFSVPTDSSWVPSCSPSTPVSLPRPVPPPPLHARHYLQAPLPH